MHKEIMCKNDVLNSDNVGSAMLNLSDVMEDMSGLIYSLKPFIAENTEHELLPHIVRSLETFKILIRYVSILQIIPRQGSARKEGANYG